MSAPESGFRRVSGACGRQADSYTETSTLVYVKLGLKNMGGEQELTVGEVAKRSGVAVSTIHFYESKGLISGWRTSGNQRRYPRSILRRIAIIRVAQRAGIPLLTIKKHMDNMPSGVIKAKEWHKLSVGWREMLDERITSLLQLRDQLEGCIGCGCLSLKDCPMRNPDDILGRDGPGARLFVAKRGKRP